MQVMLEILNIILAIPAVVVALMVLSNWAPTMFRRIVSRKPAEATDWLLAGVCVGFGAVALNASFWALYFLFEFVGATGAKTTLYKIAPIANILTRHIPYTVAGAFHLVAIFKDARNKRSNWWTVIFAISATVFSYILLSIIANGHG